jgi:queuine tRNA-ribosyltransferase subunit QTRTD1
MQHIWLLRTVSDYSRHTYTVLTLTIVLEKREPPIMKLSKDKPRNLHNFTAFSSERAIILGPRRFPSVLSPVGNGTNFISIFTSTGFRNLTIPEFAKVIETTQPDVCIPPADLFHTSTTPVSKRQIRMVERTEDWIDEFFRLSDPQGRLKDLGVSVFAPVLAVEYPIQWDYLRHLSEDVRDSLSGLAIYDVNLLPELINYPPLLDLPRLSFGPAKSPQDLLRQISLGVDVCTVPFVNVMSDAGIALTFKFPAPEVQGVQQLGIDMWTLNQTASLEPLAEGCKCYTCTKHHKAFIQHLLNAREMLGWNLLQIHNHWVLSEFFAGVRKAISESSDKFEECRRKFSATYESELPIGVGERPRVRGYHFKSIAGQVKLNEPSWQLFETDTSTPSVPGTAGEPPVAPSA